MSGGRYGHFQLGGGTTKASEKKRLFNLDDEGEIGVRQKHRKGFPGK